MPVRNSCQYGKLKFKGESVRPWVLVKKRNLTNEEVRIALEKGEKLQEKVAGGSWWQLVAVGGSWWQLVADKRITATLKKSIKSRYK